MSDICNMLDACVIFKINITELLESKGDAVSKVLGAVFCEKARSSRKTIYSVKHGDCIFEDLQLTNEEKFDLAKNLTEYKEYFIIKTRYGHAVVISKFVNHLGVGILLIPSEKFLLPLKHIYGAKHFIPLGLIPESAYSDSSLRFLRTIERSIMFGTSADACLCKRLPAIDCIYSCAEMFDINIRFIRPFAFEALDMSPLIYSLFSIIFSAITRAVGIGGCLELDPLFSGKKGSVTFSVKIPEDVDIEETQRLENCFSILKEQTLTEFISGSDYIFSEKDECNIFSARIKLFMYDPSAVGLKNPDLFKKTYDPAKFFSKD